jgi:hypothetical protein
MCNICVIRAANRTHHAPEAFNGKCVTIVTDECCSQTAADAVLDEGYRARPNPLGRLSQRIQVEVVDAFSEEESQTESLR